VLDGAQNRESAKRLKYSVEQIFNYDRLIVILGLSGDKDIRGVCEELSTIADEFVITRAGVERAANPGTIRGYLRGQKAIITSDVKEALGVALRNASSNDLILATGSFFVIGEIRELVLDKDKGSGLD
jgi:dihydrofolate synthase/folylpolyglutamate synthase